MPERLSELIADELPEPSFAVDREGQVHWVNHRLTQQFPSLVPGVNVGAFFKLPHARTRTLIDLALSSSERMPFRFRTSDQPETAVTGEHWRLSRSLQPIAMFRLTDKTREPSRFLLLTQTIGELNREIGRRREIELSLQDALHRAAQANQVKERILAEVSHDLRTPLNAILGFSEAMTTGLGGELSERQREYVGFIQESGHILLSYVEKILSVSEPGAETKPITDALTELYECLSSCISIISKNNQNKILEYLVPERDRLPMLKIEKSLISSILDNIVGNAAKYSPNGGKVRIDCIRQADDGLSLLVSDEGPGMAKEEIAFALLPFYRSKSSFVAEHEGYGLGLAIVAKNIESFGGSISFESDVGAGMQVRIDVPPHLVNWA
jgi:signal transduction histidine kinase